MRSRVTMAGSRFPGSRVIAFDHLPRGPSGAPVACLVVDYPPTVAGAAAELPTEVDAPHSLEESLRTLPITKLASGDERVNIRAGCSTGRSVDGGLVLLFCTIVRGAASKRPTRPPCEPG